MADKKQVKKEGKKEVKKELDMVTVIYNKGGVPMKRFR